MSDKKELVWQDDTGTYKLGYSQIMQRKMYKINILLLICLVILIVMFFVGFIYAHNLITRLDQLDVVAKIIGGI